MHARVHTMCKFLISVIDLLMLNVPGEYSVLECHVCFSIGREDWCSLRVARSSETESISSQQFVNGALHLGYKHTSAHVLPNNTRATNATENLIRSSIIALSENAFC